MKPENLSMCIDFFSKLADSLKETHEVVESCNADCTKYLIPKGTIGELTYYGKPANSFRVSDHWNWYANINKCANRRYIQCLNVDLPWAKKRKTEDGPSSPIWASQVAKLGSDGKYHCIFGEAFDKKTKTWKWIEA